VRGRWSTHTYTHTTTIPSKLLELAQPRVAAAFPTRQRASHTLEQRPRPTEASISRRKKKKKAHHARLPLHCQQAAPSLRGHRRSDGDQHAAGKPPVLSLHPGAHRYKDTPCWQTVLPCRTDVNAGSTELPSHPRSAGRLRQHDRTRHESRGSGGTSHRSCHEALRDLIEKSSADHRLRPSYESCRRRQSASGRQRNHPERTQRTSDFATAYERDE
jgi:hypothetical protein